MKRLVLFDIDGTILTTDGAGKKALGLAVREHFGVEDGMAGIEMGGRTDTSLAREIFARVSEEPTPGAIGEFLDCYLGHLERLLPTLESRLLPGVVPLLEALRQREDILLGLLTGNLARGAELKLSAHGLWEFFTFGAFADDHHERNELARVARARAREHHAGEIAPGRVYVLGDTPHDIACGRAIGARTVAVATGRQSRAELAGYGPDYLFDDFSDLAGVMQIFEEI